MRPTLFIVALGFALVSRAGVVAAGVVAQPVMQSVSGAGDYQYQVPADWQIDSSPGATGTLAASPDGSALAYVSTVSIPPPGGGAGGTTAEILHSVTQAAITQESTRAGYTLVHAATPASVTGADAAEEGEIAFNNTNGTVTDEYILTAVQGLQGYTLVVSVPQGSSVAETADAIVGSLVLQPIGAAST